MSPASTALAEYRTWLEEFVHQLLSGYPERLRTRSIRAPKEFNDPIWGTIVLRPLEIAVLDSPLLQRLRYIRQLGVAHWVYPAAGHTRFEHSIGAVHQVQRLITAINQQSLAPVESPITSELTSLLRLAALCHDVGHGVMSHVSENALERTDLGETVRLEFADETGREQVKISEITAHIILGSPAFGTLLEASQMASGDSRLPRDAQEKLQLIVVGMPVSQEIPLLHELISGPFDADKLDYMSRDAQMAGVPIVTDMSRLVQKIRVVQKIRTDLPSEIAEVVDAERDSFTITGIALSGGRTLDELMLGRALLFDKIYRHHKVRAAEAMVASLLEQLDDLVAPTPLATQFAFTDEELLSLSDQRLAALTTKRMTPQRRRRSLIVADIARRLRERHLLVRALAFAQTMPLDPYRADPDQLAGLRDLVTVAKDPVRRASLLDNIVNELMVVLKILDASHVASEFPNGDIRPYIRLDPPAPSAQPIDVTRAFLISDSGTVTRFKDDFAETKGWADAYLLTRDTGYLFTPAELAPYAFLAAEKVLRHAFGVRIPVSMRDYAKQDSQHLRQLRRQLAAKGYYAGSPHDIRPLPDRLAKADVENRLGKVVGQLQAYGGITADPGALGKHGLDPERMKDWLRQFEADGLIDAALRTVEEVRLIGRDEANAALRRFMDGHPEFCNGFLCQFGSPRDSSAVTAYFTGDVTQLYGLRPLPVHDALRLDGPIVFVDDIIASGNQAAGILETWLGLPHAVDLHEDHGEPLGEAFQTRLRERRVAFVFSAGFSDGVKQLFQRSREMGIEACVMAHLTDADLPSVFSSAIFTDERQAKAFREKCREIGLALLHERSAGKPAGWAAERALGYGNHGLLVVFPYNTPTHTLTCLWARGKFESVDWFPLFPRRD